jgi:hypothetical protein
MAEVLSLRPESKKDEEDQIDHSALHTDWRTHGSRLSP